LLALRARFFSDQIAPAGSLVVDMVKARSFRPPRSAWSRWWTGGWIVGA